MDVQTIGGKPVTNDNAFPPANFRAYSPQIADHRRLQQDTPACNRGHTRATASSP